MFKQLAGGLAALDMARDAARLPVQALINSSRVWEFEIARYERADRAGKPRPGAILFTGGSTIRLWRSLPVDLAPLPILNRGFGGAHLTHVNRFARRIVLPYRPEAIVLYAGDNDLGAWTGKSARDVVEEFERFVALVREELPGTRLYFVSIKPSSLRGRQWPEQQRVNARIQELGAADPGLAYIDVATPMLAGRDRPARELFAWDGLHLSEAGYALWTSVLRQTLLRDFAHLAGPTEPS